MTRVFQQSGRSSWDPVQLVEKSTGSSLRQTSVWTLSLPFTGSLTSDEQLCLSFIIGKTGLTHTLNAYDESWMREEMQKSLAHSTIQPAPPLSPNNNFTLKRVIFKILSW